MPTRFVVPVDDLDAAIATYTTHLGFATRFRDGDVWAVLDAGPLSVALAAGAERTELPGPALMVRVTDVAAAVEALVAAGARASGPSCRGEHETRATVRLGGGGTVMLYEPTTS